MTPIESKRVRLLAVFGLAAPRNAAELHTVIEHNLGGPSHPNATDSTNGLLSHDLGEALTNSLFR